MDVDCGVDDAQAIMLVLAAPNAELLGVTCVHGNTDVEQVCKNTLRVLEACKRLDVGATFSFPTSSAYFLNPDSTYWRIERWLLRPVIIRNLLPLCDKSGCGGRF